MQNDENRDQTYVRILAVFGPMASSIKYQATYGLTNELKYPIVQLCK